MLCAIALIVLAVYTSQQSRAENTAELIILVSLDIESGVNKPISHHGRSLAEALNLSTTDPTNSAVLRFMLHYSFFPTRKHGVASPEGRVRLLKLYFIRH